MGFYGDAIYYLPNGIAAEVLDGIITPIKLDRGYQECIHLGEIDTQEKANKLKEILTFNTNANSKLEIVDELKRTLIIKTGTEIRSKVLRFRINPNGTNVSEIISILGIPSGAYYAIGFLDRYWLLINSTEKTICSFDSINGNYKSIIWKKNDLVSFKNISEIETNFFDIEHRSKPTFGIGSIISGGDLINYLPTGPCVIYCYGGIYYFYCANGSQYKYNLNSKIWTRVQIESHDIRNETITGGNATLKGNIAPKTILEYNMGDNSVNSTLVVSNSIYGNALGDKHHIASGSIGTNDIATDSITKSKIATRAIHGVAGTKTDANGEISSHIAKESVGGGKNGDIAENTITNYNIAPDTIERDRLANDYLEYIYYNPDGGITFDGLKAYLSNSKLKISNILISFQLVQDIDYLSKGNYLAIPCLLNGSYSGGYVLWHLANLNTKQEWIWNVHGNIQELKNTDINIAEDAIKELHVENRQIHGSGDDEYYPNYLHIAEKSIGTNDIADKAIKRNQINDWAVQKEHIAGHAIQGLASDDVFILTDGTKKSHIAPESIAGGENGDIAPDTITNYNIAPGTITENKLANKFLKIAHYTDQEIPTTLQEICNLLRQSYGGTNTLVTFSLGNSNDINSAVYNGLTPGDYLAYPALMNGSNGAPGYWYLHNLSTDEHWKIETYTQVLNKIYLNDYIDTNLKEYDSVIELKNDLDQHPMKTYIIGMQRAVSNLPSGRYVALPTHEQIGIMKSNRILINLTTGVSYSLRTTSANTVIVSTFAGHPTANSEWIISNNFTNTTVSNDDYGIGRIKLSNTVKYTDLPFATTKYLIRDYELLANEEFSTECLIVAMVPTHETITSSNPGQSRLINSTGKLLFITGVLGNSAGIPSGAYWNIPFKDLSGADILYGYDTAFLFKMTITNINSSIIQCNIDFVTSLDAPW